MSQSLNIILPEKLQQHAQSQVSKTSTYESVPEYIQGLVRKDYQQHEDQAWEWLYNELEEGIHAKRRDFVPLDIESLIAEAKQCRAVDAS